MQLIFLIVSAVGLLSALGTVLARNLVHAALFLMAFFFAVACQFVLLEAEFLAAMQVLVYIGAVSILLLFGIMLTRNIQGDETTGGHWAWKLPAGIVAAGVLGVLLLGIAAERGRPGQEPWTRTLARPGGVNPSASGPETRALAYSPTGAYVASADADGRVRLWSSDGRQVGAFQSGTLDPRAVAFSDDGSLVAAADDRGVVRTWQLAARRPVLGRFGGRPGRVTSMAVGPRRPGIDDPNDRLLAVGGADGVVRFWDGPEPREIAAHDGPVAAMAFGPDGRLVTAGTDRRIKRWDLGDLDAPRADAMESAPEGRPIAAVAIGVVPGPIIGPDFVAGELPPLVRAAGLPDGPLVAVASLADDESGRWDLRVLNAPDGAEVASFEGLSGVPTALTLAVDGRRAAALVDAYDATVDEDGADAGPEGSDIASAPSLMIWELGTEAGGGEPITMATAGTVGGASILSAGPKGVRVALASGGSPLSFYDDLFDRWSPPRGPAITTAAVVADMPRAVGDELMTRYVVPFEVAGLMLTAALVGAIVLARQDPNVVGPPLPGSVADRLASGRPIAPGAVGGAPAAMPSAPSGNGDVAPIPETPGARPSR